MFVVAPAQMAIDNDGRIFEIGPDYAGEVARHRTLIGAIRATPSRLPMGTFYAVWEVGDGSERRVTIDETDDARIAGREAA